MADAAPRPSGWDRLRRLAASEALEAKLDSLRENDELTPDLVFQDPYLMQTSSVSGTRTARRISSLPSCARYSSSVPAQWSSTKNRVRL